MGSIEVRRRRIPSAVLVVLLCTTGWPSSAAGAGTEQRRFEAFRADGAPTVPIRKTQEADSCSASFVNSQVNALRCFVGNLIRDPCFQNPADPDLAVCTPSPWSRSSV